MYLFFEKVLKSLELYLFGQHQNIKQTLIIIEYFNWSFCF